MSSISIMMLSYLIVSEKLCIIKRSIISNHLGVCFAKLVKEKNIINPWVLYNVHGNFFLYSNVPDGNKNDFTLREFTIEDFGNDIIHKQINDNSTALEYLLSDQLHFALDLKMNEVIVETP